MSYPERIRKQISAQKQVLEDLFQGIDTAQMNRRPSQKRWSALECMEHINMTLRYYNTQIEKSIRQSQAKGQGANEDYRPGFVGERFARWLAPRDGVVKGKIRTFPSFNPQKEASTKGMQVLEDFRQCMDELDALAEAAGKIDLEKTRVRSAMGNILRFKLGDTFPIVLAHNERHLLQARKALTGGK